MTQRRMSSIITITMGPSLRWEPRQGLRTAKMHEQAGMGVDFEDYNNDGWLDIVVTNFSDDTTTLYRNTGKGFSTYRSAQAC